MSTSSFPSPGRTLLSLAAFSTSVSYIADWNETYVKNPHWPPHARFHNGMTMSMGLCLGVLTGYFTWRPTRDKAAARDSLNIAVIIGSLYWVTGLSAILYPGSKWQDLEIWRKSSPKIGIPNTFGSRVAWLVVGKAPPMIESEAWKLDRVTISDKGS